MDGAGKVRQVAVDCAQSGADIEAALPRFVRITRDRAILGQALERLADELHHDPTDPVLLRASELLRSALATAIYRPGRATEP